MSAGPVSTLEPGPGRAVTSLAIRQVRRGAAIVLIAVAGLSALVAVQYQQLFAGAFDSASLRALAANPAIRVLFGEPVALDDPGGFTVWRTGTFAAVLTGLWALLTATRITRGEEEAGRWDLLLGGRLSARSTVARHLVVVAGAALSVGAAVAAAMLLAGAAPGGSFRYGAALGLLGAAYAGVGTLAAQLAADRPTASGLAAAVLAGTLLLRMVADGSVALHWLRWATPFGLLGEVQPYAANRSAPLVVLAAAAALISALALVAAGRRDIGTGLIRARDTRPPRTRLLRSLMRFAVRRSLYSLTGWAIGLGAFFLLIGLLADSLTGFLADSPQYADLAAQAGFADLDTVGGYVAALFSVLAIPVGVYTAARIAADSADESARRLTPLLALPVSRIRWAGTEAGATAGAGTILAVVAGVAAWAGTAIVGAPLGLADALAGAVNALPTAMLCLGAALLALGWTPSAVLPVGVLPAAGGYLLRVFALTFDWPTWIRQLSPFSHVATVPARPADWRGAAGILVVGALLAILGISRYARRDLRG